MSLGTDHSVLWVGLFMGHLQQLFGSAHSHFTEDVKPPTAERERERENAVARNVRTQTFRTYISTTSHLASSGDSANT